MIAIRSQKKLTRWIKRGLAIAAALVFAWLLVVAWMPKPIPADLVEVTRGRLSITVDEDGRTRVRDAYVVSAPITGNVSRIDLRPGDSIARGQTVAWIVPLSPALLDVRSRAEAQSRINAAAASKQRAQASISQAKAAFDFAKKEAERLGALAKQKTIPRREGERAMMEYQRATAELDSARHAEEVAEHELAMARAALGSVSSTKLEQMAVTAPSQGKVLRVQHQSEGVVQMGTPLLEIGDPTKLEIVVDLLTEDATRVRPGDPVAIESWGGEEMIAGHVRTIEPSAFTRISALGVEEQRVNVIIDLDAPEEELGDGYRIEARIEVWEAEDVVRVPASAAFRHQDGYAVFAVNNGVVEVRPIQVGRSNGVVTQVLGGLKGGETVVAYPSDAIREGVKVVSR